MKVLASPVRMASLDGLRAVSIALVLLWHFKGADGMCPLLPAGHIGHLGVRIFFVISGFLITTLLLGEIDRTGGVSLRRFYARRTLRIFPAFYVYLAVVLILGAANVVERASGHMAGAGLYLANNDPARPWYLEHLWSLAVEEQFYLLWPFVLCFAGRERALRACAALLCAAPLVRLGISRVASEHTQIFPAVADALAAGCLLAGARERLSASATYLRALRSPLFLAMPVLILVVNRYGYSHPTAGLLVGETVVNVAIALCIDRWVRVPGDAIGRLLNWRPVAFVGVLSYSIYLWQQLFLAGGMEPMLEVPFPLNAALVLVAALISYRLVEQPLQGLRDRLRRASLAPVREPALTASDVPSADEPPLPRAA